MIPGPGQNYLCYRGPIGSKAGLSHDSGPAWAAAPGHSAAPGIVVDQNRRHRGGMSPR